ncbi:hypothetical protein CARUB_v10002494mg [Capsella rubella]|uniref:Uncharacterized protein n=1 Tax=Capsella rubella TaxID=81985 RepID=R0FCM2_9BRAS|nr:hypothetical protein CARUB_v10002494mg [Capsella rubella]
MVLGILCAKKFFNNEYTCHMLMPMRCIITLIQKAFQIRFFVLILRGPNSSSYGMAYRVCNRGYVCNETISSNLSIRMYSSIH